MKRLLTRRIEVSPRRWMLLPMEYKSREFEGTAMLAFEAAERGWGVVLGSKSIRAKPYLPRSMVIEKWIEPGTLKKTLPSREMGRRLSAWCEEGLVYPNAVDYGLRKVERRTYELLDLFFCWGRNQANDMADTLGCSREKMVISGNPRFDLHRADLHAILAEKAKAIRERYTPSILVNTSFVKSNGFYTPTAQVEKMRKRLEAHGINLTKKQEVKFYDSIAFDQRMMSMFLELLQTLSTRFPAHNIIVRPHPSERPDPWTVKASGLRNVKVIRRGNVAEWLLASEVCIHTNCTTGVEAYLLKKPAIAYRPITDPRFDLFLPNSLSVQAFGIEQVVTLVDAALRGEGISTAQEERAKSDIARHFIANVDGKRACESIVDALDTVDLPEESLSFSGTLMGDITAALSRKVKQLRAVLRGSEETTIKRHSATKLEGLDLSETLRFLRTAQETTGRFGNVQVAELEKRVLCVY